MWARPCLDMFSNQLSGLGRRSCFWPYVVTIVVVILTPYFDWAKVELLAHFPYCSELFLDPMPGPKTTKILNKALMYTCALTVIWVIKKDCVFVRGYVIFVSGVGGTRWLLYNRSDRLYAKEIWVCRFIAAREFGYVQIVTLQNATLFDCPLVSSRLQDKENHKPQELNMRNIVFENTGLCLWSLYC